MGLLDQILASYTGLNGFGSTSQPAPADPLADEQRRRAMEAAAMGGMGVDPMMPQPAPAPAAPPVAAPQTGNAAPPLGSAGIAGASPWGALYSPPAIDEWNRPRQPTMADPTGSDRMGVPMSPFGPDPMPAPAPSGFGAGATPFGFAGPGSMTGVSPAMFQPPAAAPATDLSSANRAPSPSPVADDGPDRFASVGNYRMPVYGEAPEAPGASAPVAAPQSAPTAAPRPAPAPFSLAGLTDGGGDRLSKGATGFIGNLHNGPLGALAGGIGALITGRSTDAGSIEAEKLATTNNATARALLSKGASAEDVVAAMRNPALMTALVTQYYGKDKWAVVQTGEDENGRKTYQQQNQVDGTLRDIPRAVGGAAGNEAPGFVTGPDGKQIPIPPGVNRKEFIKKVSDASADAATGKGTEAQTKAAAFATRMTQAQSLLAPLEKEGTGFWAKQTDMLPGGNYLQSPEYQKYKQASSAFITAMLRQESGAAINKDEFARYERELFPQPGDGPGVIAQKSAARAAATEQMQRSAGSMFKPPAAAAPVAPPAAGARLQPGQTTTIGNISIKRVN